MLCNGPTYTGPSSFSGSRQPKHQRYQEVCGKHHTPKSERAGERRLILDGFQLQHPKGGARAAKLVRIRTIDECCHNRRMLLRIRTYTPCETPCFRVRPGNGSKLSHLGVKRQGPTSNQARQRRPYLFLWMGGEGAQASRCSAMVLVRISQCTHGQDQHHAENHGAWAPGS